MRPILVLLLLTSLLTLAACSCAQPTPPPTPAPTIPPGGAAPEDRGDGPRPPAATPTPGPGGLASPLDQLQRQVISTASLTLEVEVVEAAVAQVRAIAESQGGFVEQLSSSGTGTGQRATMTVRVPQLQFFPALERIQALGEVQRQDLGSQDVTDQFIDLEARLASLQRQEQSLLALLERTESLSDVLALERELSRVRGEVERLQGQLAFLERRVELATITVTLQPPPAAAGTPPSAELEVEVRGVESSVGDVRTLVQGLDGVVDAVTVNVDGDRRWSRMVVRVFRDDFSRVLAVAEEQGDLLKKTADEGFTPVSAAATPAREPDARLVITFVQAGPPWYRNPGLIIAWLIGIAVVFGLGYLVARYGRRPTS